MSDGLDFPVSTRSTAVEKLPIHYLDPASGAWTERAEAPLKTGTAASREITCVTFNTWFQGLDAPLRYAGLLQCLEASRADVIMLQEVTVALLETLRAAPWFRREFVYVRSDFRVDTIPSHGLLLLARFPVVEATLYPLRTYMGRKLLVARCIVNGAPLVFATVHLESMKNYADVRGDQLHSIFGILKDHPEVILAGDFNFCSSAAEENRRIDGAYTDLWPALRPGEPGYTQDTDVNLMLANSKRETKRVRIDRVLLRSESSTHRWLPASIELLGTAPVDARHPRIFPSDHFGIAATMRIAD